MRPTCSSSPYCASFARLAPKPDVPAGGAQLEVKYLGIDPTIRGGLDEGGNYKQAQVGIANDIKKPGMDEVGYDRTPLLALASMRARVSAISLVTEDVNHLVP